MIACDRIYGVVNVTEPVFSDIIAAPTFQRLQGINMGPWRPNMPFYSIPVSRYHHSIGVFMLLRIHGASVPEQIAGLIHDVSHTAFSHLSDRLFGDMDAAKTQEYQDDVHEKFVKNSELAEIITRAGFDLDMILDDTPFKLKENELPDLCADRLDYCLRAIPHMHQYGKLIECDEVALSHAIVATPDGFVMRDADSARMFAHAFNTTDEQIYSSFTGVFYEEMLARICRDAIKDGILTRDDFFHMNDMQVIRKMHMAGVDFSALYANPNEWRAADDDVNAVVMPQKLRRVDPPFIDTDGIIRRLSDVDADFARYIKACPKFVEYKIKKALKSAM
ncbi:MAG: HD domain-containing protein [Alphaproteobacteria bacterium]|nr:HD domain-containing protein [Alphaproteobacteria bacterium]